MHKLDTIKTVNLACLHNVDKCVCCVFYSLCDICVLVSTKMTPDHNCY